MPCENCITLAMCLSQMRVYADDYKDPTFELDVNRGSCVNEFLEHHIWGDLAYGCCILKNYLKEKDDNEDSVMSFYGKKLGMWFYT